MTKDGRFKLSRRTTCRICGSAELTPHLDLGEQPPSNSFLDPDAIAAEQTFPLRVYLCRQCGLSQLLDIVASQDIFDDYLYLSSTSRALCRHYAGLVDSALTDFDPAENSLVIDIGCNDGVLLKGYPPGRHRLLGIEPSSAGKYAQAAGFEVVKEFFDAEAGARVRNTHGPAQIATATNVFAHVDDVQSFAAGIRVLLADDGVYIIEFPYLLDMVDGCYFDTIYHEHLSYFALTPLMRLFQDTGLRAFRVTRVEVGASGPGLRLFVCREEAPHGTDNSIDAMLAHEREWGVTGMARYEDFCKRVSRVRKKLLDMIEEFNLKGHKLGAFGAPAKGNTLLNFLGLTSEDIVAVSDNNELKVGKVTPGTHIPIVDDAAFLRTGVSHALLLAWNYAPFFLENAEFIKQGGKFIIPLPTPEIRP